jgi:hypothetical protein
MIIGENNSVGSTQAQRVPSQLVGPRSAIRELVRGGYKRTKSASSYGLFTGGVG